MILVYRPELENPPMDKDCSIGFSFVQGQGEAEYIQITSGVTRNFPESVWNRIKNYDVTKNLLSIGAMRVEEDAKPTLDATGEGSVKTAPVDADSIMDLPIVTALQLIETSFDTSQLNKWAARDQRVKIRNAIAKRLNALMEGNG